MLTAVFQTDIQFENKEYNLLHAEALIAKAAKKGAELCFFPEMSFTGFSMNTARTAETDGYTVKRLTAAAVKNGIAIGFGHTVLRDGKAENHYSITDKSGMIVSDYIKIHSFAIGGERGGFRSGDVLPYPAHIGEHTISTFICYDLRFPEIFRAAADRSSVMTVAANWPAVRREHWLTLIKARAIENQTYTIGINCCGAQGGIVYSGDSIIAAPDGSIIAQAQSGAETVIYADIPNDVNEYRKRFPVLKSRRPELYPLLGK